jgi:uncharacterized protein YjbJ (UPF0337 family)
MDSASQKKWEGKWDQLKGKVRQAWGNLTDDDVDVAEGNYEELIGRVKSRTGEAEQDVRRRFDSF